MAIRVNRAEFGGNVVRKPELSYTKNKQTAVLRFTMAYNPPVKPGEPEPEPDYLNVVIYGSKAERADKKLRAGSECLVWGRIKTGSYTNKEGRKVKTYELVVSDIQYGARCNFEEQGNAYGDQQTPQVDPAELPDMPPAEEGAVPRETQQIDMSEVGFTEDDADVPF